MFPHTCPAKKPCTNVRWLRGQAGDIHAAKHGPDGGRCLNRRIRVTNPG